MIARIHASDTELLDPFACAGRALATVHLPMISDRTDAARRIEVVAQNAARTTAELGGDELGRAVADALAEHQHSEGATLTLVADQQGVVFARAHDDTVAQAIVSVDTTPSLLPLLRARQGDVAHLAVLLDRTGAEVWSRAGLTGSLDAASIDGDTLHIHRGKPGGWSQRRFQQITENQWEANAKTVVNAVVDDAPEVEALVVGGDERAVGFFVDHLPERLKPATVVAGARSEPEAFLDAVDGAIRTIAAERLVAEMRAASDAVGEGRAVVGEEALQLLTQGRIGRVYVVDDSAQADRPRARFDFTVPAHVEGGGDGTAAPVTEGAVALAVATGAEVVVLPSSGLPGVTAAVIGEVRGA